MNEEFAIKLKMMLDQSSIAEVKKQLHDIGQEASESAQATMPKPEATEMFDIENMEEAEKHYWEILQIQTKIADLQTTLSLADVLGLSSQEIIDLNVEIEKLKNKIASLTKDGGADVFVFSKTTVMIKNNLKQVRRSIMGIVGGLVGARSIYTSIRKAMSTYLAQNDELQAKLNGAWYALGSLFAPVLEWIVNKFVYLVSLVDALVKSLGFAGVNMSKYGKAGAKASKQLAGFDEINNMNQQSGGGGSGMELDPVADDALNKFKAILALVAGIGAGILAWKLATTFMEQLGWTQKECIGLGLAIGGIVTYVLAFADAWKNGLNLDNLRVMILAVTAVATGLYLMLGPTASAIGMIVGGVGLLVLGIKEFIQTGQLSENACLAIVAGITLIGTAIGLLIGGPLGAIVGFITGVIIGGIVPLVLNNWESIKSWFKSGLGAIKQWFIDTWNSVKTKTNELWNTLKSGVYNFFTGIGSTISEKVRSIINTYIISPINKVISWINGALNFSYGGKTILGRQVIPPFSVNLGNLKSLPSLDVGTNFVPNDMLAMVHQGEAVVPKAFNEDQYNNSEETNELLRELINVVDSKEFRAYISQREIGKSAISYINQQSRIMGGSII